MSSVSAAQACYDCLSNHEAVLSTVESVEDKVDELRGDLADYVQTYELTEAQDVLCGRQDELDEAVGAVDGRVGVLEAETQALRGELEHLGLASNFLKPEDL